MMNIELVILLAGAFILRLVHLDQSFWLDEAAQAFESGRPFLQQFELSAVFHPPLYHVFLHFWMKGGTSEVWLRLPSVIFGTVSVWLLYHVARIYGGRQTGWLAGLFLAFSPFHIWYSQEARPYMFASLIILVCTYCYLKRQWKLYTCFLAAAFYSTYLAFFLIPVHAAGIFLWEKEKKHRVFLTRAITVACIVFLPWVPSFVEQLGVGMNGSFPGWTSVVSVSPIKSIPLTFAKFIFGKGSIDNNSIYGLTVAPVFLLFCYSVVQIIRRPWGKMMTLLFLGPMFLAAAESFLVPVTAPQRLLFLLPIFYLILSVGIRNFTRIHLLFFSAMVIGTGVIGIGQYWTDPTVQREQWRQAVQAIEFEAQPNALAVFVFPGSFAPYRWYQRGVVEAIAVAPAFVVRREDLQQILSPRLPETQQVFLFQYLTGLTDPQESTRRFLSTNGFSETGKKNFEGVGFIYVFIRH